MSSLASAVAVVMIPLGSPVAHADVASAKDPVVPHFRTSSSQGTVGKLALAKAVPTPQKYKVVSGDTLSGISVKYYKSAAYYPTIVVANKVQNPDLIYPGQVFTIPLRPNPHDASLLDVYSPSTESPTVVKKYSSSPQSPTVVKKHRLHSTPTYNPPSASYGSPQAIARSLMSGSDFGCFDYIISRESGWDITATNPSSGAYGLPQALPGYKMSSAGGDWQTNPRTQIRWAIGYMDDTYGSICGAASFWSAHSWY